MEQLYDVSVLFLLVPLTLFSVFILLYSHRSKMSSPNLPPGRMGYPVIGESLEFISSAKKGHTKKFIYDRITMYSSNVFKTSMFGHYMVMLCGATGNKLLFSSENKLVTSWWPDNVNKIFPTTLLTSSKEESKKLKHMLPHFLKAQALQRYIPIMDSIAQKHFASHWENKTQVTVFPLAKRYTFRVACRLFMNVEDPKLLEKLGKPFNTLASGIVSLPIDLPGTTFNRAIKASKFVREELIKIIKQRKLDLADGKVSPIQDILSHMLITTDENGEYMTEHNIADKILGLLIGGHDTASSVCTSIVKYLAELPQNIYQNVYREQIAIAKSKPPGELLNWNDIEKMKYSWNVACEVLRLVPPVQGAFRETINDFVFNGFSIPKGWKVYWSTSSTHKNPECFQEPEKFDPSRFEGNGPAPYTFVPFGGGPRMCPGKEYARMEILVFMHNLVKRFKWEKVIPDETFLHFPLVAPAKGLPVRLYPHQT
ncbi:hypothetical protein VNO77_21325 [Canavalia gladiata]|uniref:Cytochrome P450 n=1 Tax=Canavalia gladiata TaxID=3824 RepID=A0AAN9LR32_CANGL